MSILENTANKAQKQRKEIQKDLEMIDNAFALSDTELAIEYANNIIKRSLKMLSLIHECDKLMQDVHFAH
ncbi:MAG: hypothetical protein PHV42_04540 [Candidatus Pacebacteria bacterium]|nr:hypothetical protein [Candidatus Paceibacterota bacterium]